MSLNAMQWVWSHSRSRNAQRLVLLAIADAAAADGANAYPSGAELRRKSALSERSVQDAVKRLVALGELRVEYNAGPGGCNRYTILMVGSPTFAPPQNLHPPAESAPPTPAESAPPQNLHPAESAGARSGESQQVNTPTPAESAPPQNLHPPAESAPGTVTTENSSTKSSLSKGVRGKRDDRGTRIPDDFAVTPDMAEWARREVPELAGRRETEKFINYWKSKPGAGGRKIDWVATWKNWMIEASDRLRTAGASTPSSQVKYRSPRRDNPFAAPATTSGGHQ